MTEEERTRRFEALALPHLDASYNLALWLTRHEQDAQDVTQEAYLRALRYFDSFDGTDAKAWLLSVVRNTAYTWLSKNRSGPPVQLRDDLEAAVDEDAPAVDAAALESADKDTVDAALAALPAEFREVIVLRELERLSYKEIARAVGAPIGTVMSRLSRARALLRKSLSEREVGHERL